MNRTTVKGAAVLLALGLVSACSASSPGSSAPSPGPGDRDALYDQVRGVGAGWPILTDDDIDLVLDATCGVLAASVDFARESPEGLKELGFDTPQDFAFAVTVENFAGDAPGASEERIAAVSAAIFMLARCVDERPELAP